MWQSNSQEEVKRKINIENDTLVGLYPKQDIGQLTKWQKQDFIKRNNFKKAWGRSKTKRK